MRMRCNIKISTLWIVFLPLLWLSSFRRIYFHILLILMFHESMHVLCAIVLKVKVETILIYPFGMCAKIHGFGNGIPCKELMIAMMGILSHIIIGVGIYYLMKLQYLSKPYYHYLMDVNVGLALFNCIPVYPLDGFSMLQAIVHQFFPYRIAYCLSLFISVCCFVLFFDLWFSSLSALMIACLSLGGAITLWIHRQKHHQLFYWYRLMHPYCGKEKIHARNDLYRGYTNYLMTPLGIFHETKWLKEKLSKW